jgi:glycerophosphoryl diester phosphodiesterase
VGNLPLIIAHRGASAVAPENTLIAFKRALEAGADGVECDVRLARDDVPVLFHDLTLKRTALRDGKISELTSKELSKIRVGSWFNLKNPKRAQNSFASETVPTLAQLFKLMRNNDKLIYVELKCQNGNYVKLARAAAQLIYDFDLQNRAIIKSFDHEAVREVQQNFPDIRTAALFAPRPMRVLRPTRALVKAALHLDADELSLHYSLATERTVQKAIGAGLKTVIWTANHPAWVKRALKLGLYGIITNNPARLIAKRDELFTKSKV